MTDTIVLYHGGCRDGFCAAWVVNKWIKDQNNKYGNIIEAQFIPAYYGQDPPDVTNKDVIIVDFCYPLETMREIVNKCQSLILLDHHKTNEFIVKETLACATVHGHFDNSHSGAGIAWDYFFPNESRPWLVDYVEDRDLWSKKLYETDKINSLIACLKLDFNVWDYWNQIDYPGSPGHELIAYGKIAEMKTEQYVREICKNTYFKDINDPHGMQWEFKNIPIVNICQVDCSEVLHELCKRYPNSPFSLYWFKRADELYQYGMRSIGDFDVSVVAKLFGGGGHKNAAGFQLPYLLEELK